MMVFGPPVAPYKAASAGADCRCGHKTFEDQKLLFKGLFQELGLLLLGATDLSSFVHSFFPHKLIEHILFAKNYGRC